MQTLSIQTQKAKQIVDLTSIINKNLNKNQTLNGICYLFIKHTTAALTTADLDPGTDLDMIDAFDAMMPKLSYRHPHNPSHVTDHILASIIGASLTLPIQNGVLDLGTWQRVVLIELDGPRDREVVMSVLKE